MTIEVTIKVLDDLKRKGIIEMYAIGGGIACIVYMEPFLTYDLDVFVSLPSGQSELTDIGPIYEYTRGKGYEIHHEHVLIDGVPVQFIPVYNELVEEATREAIQLKYKDTEMRVLRIEHLLAIMIQTNRPKDRARALQVLDQARIDHDYLIDVLRRHRLSEAWSEFRRTFRGEE